MNNKVKKTISAYKYLAKTFARQNVDRSVVFPDIEKFAKLLPKKGKLLDLGCGVGFDSRDFNKLRPDLEILGLDASTEMLDEFRVIAPSIPYILADMVSYEYPKEYYDGIWMNASLLHIPKSQSYPLMIKVVSSLKKGGKMYIKVKEGKGERFVSASKYGRRDIKRFFSFYTKKELENLLKEFPLKIIFLGRTAGVKKRLSAIVEKE